MEKEFIPYEQALKLKELGFKEECLGCYYKEDKSLYLKGELNEGNIEYKVKAPLWQQAFDWFREKHGIYADVDWIWDDFKLKTILWTSNIRYTLDKWIENDGNCYNPSDISEFKTFEESRLVCLNKLIEIIDK